MSAAGRGAVRHPRDFYGTPSWCIRRLLETRVLDTVDGTWLEPGAGGGKIIRATQDYYADFPTLKPRWCAVEIYAPMEPLLQQVAHEVVAGDFLGPEVKLGHYDVALGNPPYGQAMKFIERALKHADQVCFLLRLNFLASKKRAEFMRRHTPTIYVLPDRPSFTGGGTDATDYAWFHWDQRRPDNIGEVHVLNSTSKDEKKESR